MRFGVMLLVLGLVPAVLAADDFGPADLVIRVHADERVTLEGVSGPGAWSELQPTVLTAVRNLSPNGALRARLYADEHVRAHVVQTVMASLKAQGIRYADLAQGSVGGQGVTVDFGPREQVLPPGAGTSEVSLPARPSQLSIVVTEQQLWLSRWGGSSVKFPVPVGPGQDTLLAMLLDEDRRLHPGATLVIVETVGQLPYSAFFNVIAALRARSENPLRHAYAPSEPPLTPPAGAVPKPSAFIVPEAVQVVPTGTFILTGASRGDLTLGEVTSFVEDCARADCVVVAMLGPDTGVLVGTRPRSENPTRGWIFGKPVAAQRGFAQGLRPPRTTGVFSPMVQVEGLSPTPAKAGDPSPPAVLGQVDRTLIDGVVRAKIGSLQGCYQALLGRRPQAQGRVKFQFEIGATGGVTQAKITETTLDDPEAQACMLQTVMALQFPAPAGGGRVVVVYPFVFSP